MLLTSNICFAQAVVVITGEKVINTPTTYTNVILDLSNGHFQITGGGTLDIENCVINGTIAANNPYLFHLTMGVFKLANNVINVTTRDVPASPGTTSILQVIKILQGIVNITGNTANIDLPFRVGFLVTGSLPTSNFIISNNKISGFHGGIFLSNSNNAKIQNNVFSKVSVTNILTTLSSNSLFEGNEIIFPGNNNLGNGIDLIDSENLTIRNNHISFGSCYGIYILRCHNTIIDSNHITGGITWGIYIVPSVNYFDKYLAKFMRGFKHKQLVYANQNITVTNNIISQNRYGLAAKNVDRLTATNNVFIQQFPDSRTRRFWTDNDIIFNDVINITWLNNQYKEAFTQINGGSNTLALQFVEFPRHGGVVL